MNERIFNHILAGRVAQVASTLEPKLFEPSNLEFFFSPTVYEVHHQNVKHQQRHPSRNP